MGREAQGELRKLKDGWEARITIKGRQRRGFFLRCCHTEDQARGRCNAMALLAVRLRRAGHVDQLERTLEMAANARPGRPWEAVLHAVDTICTGQAERATQTEALTFRRLAEQWIDGTLHRKWPDYVKAKKSAESDELRIEKHINPHVGDTLVDRFTVSDAEFVMANLPDKLSAASRRHVAQLMHRVLSLAVYPCRQIAANPLPRGFLPKVGPRKLYPVLYPDEDRRLLGCVSIPLERRIFCGVLHREGMRMTEALLLQWADLDLQHGAVVLERNKTDDPRRWTLSAGVAKALCTWHDVFRAEAEPSDLVFADDAGHSIGVEHMAERIRADLIEAGIDRPDLFHASDRVGRFGTHCFRRSFVTLHLADGATETWIMDRTGHRSSIQVARYRQAARSLAELGLHRPAPLNETIPELACTASNTPSLPHETRARVAELADALDLGSEKPTYATPSEAQVREDARSRSSETAPVPASLGQSWGNEDAVEAALADALRGATQAGRWDVVMLIAGELRARREERK